MPQESGHGHSDMHFLCLPCTGVVSPVPHRVSMFLTCGDGFKHMHIEITQRATQCMHFLFHDDRLRKRLPSQVKASPAKAENSEIGQPHQAARERYDRSIFIRFNIGKCRSGKSSGMTSVRFFPIIVYGKFASLLGPSRFRLLNLENRSD